MSLFSRSFTNMQEPLFIINPIANRGTALAGWNSTRRQLLDARIAFKEFITTQAGDAATHTREALANGARCVVAVGGDGTLSEVINGYLDAAGRAINPEACLGILPSGTGSDFRRSLGLQRPEDAVRAILRQESRTIDAMRVEYVDKDGKAASRFAINVVSFGLGGDVVAIVNGWRAVLPNWVSGKARFVAGALLALKQYQTRSLRVAFDGEPEFAVESNLLVVANGRFAGSGMMFAPHAELDDGWLDVILTDCASRLDVIKELPRIFRGAHLKNPKVTEHRARAVSITTTERFAVDIDGDAAGFAPAKLTLLPQAVRFLF